MMNPDPLTELWNSPTNLPDAEVGQRLAAQFVAVIRRRHRLQMLWLVWTLFAMTGVTILAVVQLRQSGLAGQWALFPLLALPWFVTLRSLRAFFSGGKQATQTALPLSAALAAARASNHTECRNLTFIVGYLIVMTPVIALAVWQLHTAGKTSLNQAWSMAFVFGAMLMLSAAAMAVRYYRYLLPEMRMIEAQQRELDRPENE
jgi:hypothetical protein